LSVPGLKNVAGFEISIAAVIEQLAEHGCC